MAGDDHNNADQVREGMRKKNKRPRQVKMLDVTISGFAEDNNCCCCRECGKRFGSPKALYGHMRCHPERWWRGIDPPSLPCDQAVVKKMDDHSVLDVAAGDDDREVAACLLMLSNERTVVNSKSSASVVSAGYGFLDLNLPAPVEQLPYSVCSSASLSLELSLSLC